MEILISAIIRIYQVLISPALQLVFGIQCRYEETCSRYMERNIREKGLRRGFVLGMKRFLSCNQWGAFFERRHGHHRSRRV